MSDKQKVTLYLSDDLHRQFKIRSAIDGETMSSMAQRALEFYLGHAELVDGSSELHGHAHQVHSCPQCSAAVTLRDNELSLVRSLGDAVVSELVGLVRIHDLNQGIAGDDSVSDSKRPDEGELITC